MQTATQLGRVLDFGATGMWWEITHSKEDTNGEYFEVLNVIEPGFGGPPLHMHPMAEESYEVIEGFLDVYVNGEWRKLGPGEKAVVPKGMSHTLRNPYRDAVRMINIHRPALDIEHFFRRMHSLVAQGKLTLPPKNLGAVIRLSMLFTAHENEIKSVVPSQWVMKVLAFIGKVFGYRLPD